MAEKRYSETRNKWTVLHEGVLHVFENENQADGYIEEAGIDDDMVNT
jgi:hypothetical protein